MEENTGPAGGQGPDQAGADESLSRKSSREALIALLKTGVVSRQRARSGQSAPDRQAAPSERATAVNADGSGIEKDERGRVIKVRDAKGHEREFRWDPDGRLSEVILPAGRWRRVEGDDWQNDRGERQRMLCHVDDLGTYVQEDRVRRLVYKKDGTRIEVHKEQRQVSIFFGNGSSFTQQTKNGVTRRVRNQDGSEYEFEVTEDGRLRPAFHQYARPIEVQFETPAGTQVVPDVLEVRFEWLEANNILRMTYRSACGRSYVLERGRYGDFKFFGARGT